MMMEVAMIQMKIRELSILLLAPVCTKELLKTKKYR